MDYIQKSLLACTEIIDLISFSNTKVVSRDASINYASKNNIKYLRSGGCVKLRTLQKEFPHHFSSPILYLVSSCLPLAVDNWIQVAKKKGVLIIVNQNGVGYPAWLPDKYLKLNSKLKRVLHSADYVIYQSLFCQQHADLFLGKVSVPSSILYNPVDTSLFSKKTHRSKKLRLLVMGSHHEKERVSLAVECLKHLLHKDTDVQLTVAGKLLWPDAELDLKLWLNDPSIQANLHIIGPYSQDEAPPIYQSSDILLHLKYQDPSPTVPIEAMATGLPVIGSYSGGLPELIGDAGALLRVTLSDTQMHYPTVDDVSDAIISVWNNYDSYSSTARVQSLKFNRESWLTKHKEIFSLIYQASSNIF